MLTAVTQNQDVSFAYASRSCIRNIARSGLRMFVAMLGVLILSASAQSQNHPPDQPQLIYPQNNATDIGSSAPAEVLVSDADGDPLTVTFYGRRVGSASDFTLAVFGDTQMYYAAYQISGTDYLTAQTQWVVQNHIAKNIAYVAQMGDVTELNTDPEWVFASNAMNYLEDPNTTSMQYGIPFGMEVGNHDELNSTTVPYNTYFGWNRYAGRDYYGGHYGTVNNNNYYELFSAGGQDFIVIYLEYGVHKEAAVLSWADQLLKQYIARRAVVVSHALLDPGDPAPWSSNGDGIAVYNALKGNPNLFLMLCGHNGADYKRSDMYNGNTVHTLMSDYSADNWGGGYIRLLNISPASKNIHATTFSPIAGNRTASPTWDLPINGFPVVGMTAALASDATVAWNSLAACAQYEWYVAVSDGVAVTIGPTWIFSTAGCGITGTVKDQLGNGISGATVTYSGGSTTTDASGKYTLSSVAPGTYTVTASASGYDDASQTATVTTGASTTADFVLTASTQGITVLPGSLTFASQAVSTTSAAQTVTLTNSGTASLTITSIVASGDFAQTNSCGTTVAAGANCAINVTFTPTAVGTRTGAVTITDNAANSPQSVSLSGTGVAAGVSLLPTSLTFASQAVSTTSAVQTVTLTNSGTASLTITSIVASGDYAQTNTCGTTVAAGANCAINVTFTPTAVGTRTGAVTITDNAANSPQSVSLSGTGVAAGVSLLPTSLTFASQAVSTTSAVQTVTLTNSGTASLTITSIVASGDYAQTNTCGTTVAAGANCAINVTFTPTAVGTRTGVVTITDNAANSPQSVSLSGTGVAAGVSLLPTSLTFTSQIVNTTSAVRSVTLTNSGTSSLTITSIVASGDFAQTNNCGTVVGVGGSCVINVTFTPTAVGTRTGAVTITDNAASSPQTVSLSGTGVAPAVSLSPTSLTFAKQTINTTSTAQAVTLTNSGTSSLTITSIMASGDFAQTNNCGASIAAGARCTINVTFTPTVSGTRAGGITITDDAADSPQTVSLTGTGVAPAPVVSSIVPNSMKVGTTINVTVTGANFSPGALLSFANGQSTAPTVTSLTVVNTTTIQATIKEKAGGAKKNRVWDVVVTNPDGSSGQLLRAFTVIY